MTVTGHAVVLLHVALCTPIGGAHYTQHAATGLILDAHLKSVGMVPTARMDHILTQSPGIGPEINGLKLLACMYDLRHDSIYEESPRPVLSGTSEEAGFCLDMREA
jgi:hypothetical protein